MGKKLPKYMTHSKVKELIKTAKKDSKRNGLIIETLYKTGLRVSELINLEKGDIKEDRILVDQGKGDWDRYIPVGEELIEKINWYADDKNIDQRIFNMTRQNVNRIINKYADQLDDLRNCYPHKLRHSYAYHLLKENANIREVQKLLGHSDLNNTKIYLDLIDRDLKKTIKNTEW